jgi:outer membrane protein assembly factor BamB
MIEIQCSGGVWGLIRNGGILSCLDATSGKVVYRARVGAAGPYYSSPVAANGRIYVASGEGMVAVLTSGDALKVLARNDLGEPIYATPRSPLARCSYARPLISTPSTDSPISR